jgi:hypothetical protein
MPDIAEGRYLPTCPHCDWEGQSTVNALAALAQSDRHIAADHKPDPVEPLSAFAAAVVAQDNEEDA